jgi:hypothetical protein
VAATTSLDERREFLSTFSIPSDLRYVLQIALMIPFPPGWLHQDGSERAALFEIYGSHGVDENQVIDVLSRTDADAESAMRLLDSRWDAVVDRKRGPLDRETQLTRTEYELIAGAIARGTLDFASFDKDCVSQAVDKLAEVARDRLGLHLQSRAYLDATRITLEEASTEAAVITDTMARTGCDRALDRWNRLLIRRWETEFLPKEEETILRRAGIDEPTQYLGQLSREAQKDPRSAVQAVQICAPTFKIARDKLDAGQPPPISPGPTWREGVSEMLVGLCICGTNLLFVHSVGANPSYVAPGLASIGGGITSIWKGAAKVADNIWQK